MNKIIEFIKKYKNIIIILLLILVIILSVVVSPYILCILLIPLLSYLYIKSNKGFSFKNSKTNIFSLLDKYNDKKGSGDSPSDDNIDLNKKINKTFMKILEDADITEDETLFLVILLKIIIKNKYNIDLIDCIEDVDLKKEYIQNMEYAKKIDVYKFQDNIKMHFKYEIDRSIINEFPKSIQLDIYHLKYLLTAIDDITKFNTTNPNYADLYVIDQLKKRSEEKDYIMISIIFKYNDADDRTYSDELYDYIYNSPIFKKLYTKLSKINDIDISNVFSAKSLKDQIGFDKYQYLKNTCLQRYDQPEDDVLDCMISLDPRNYNYYIELYNGAIKYMSETERKRIDDMEYNNSQQYEYKQQQYEYQQQQYEYQQQQDAYQQQQDAYQQQQDAYQQQKDTYSQSNNTSQSDTAYNVLSKDNYSNFIKNTDENTNGCPVFKELDKTLTKSIICNKKYSLKTHSDKNPGCTNLADEVFKKVNNYCS
jgi:hypothetical protein